MAELEEVLFTHLTGFAGLSALVAARVYPLLLPQVPTYPALTYQRIDSPHEGVMGGATDIARTRVQVDSWAETYAEAKAVATQVRLALDNWESEAVSPAIINAAFDTDGDIYEEEVGIYRVRADYLILHRL
jgi:hypothetical protein